MLKLACTFLRRDALMSFSGRTAEKLPSVLINGNARSHIWELRSQKWERSYIWVLMTIVPPTEMFIALMGGRPGKANRGHIV